LRALISVAYNNNNNNNNNDNNDDDDDDDDDDNINVCVKAIGLRDILKEIMN